MNLSNWCLVVKNNSKTVISASHNAPKLSHENQVFPLKIKKDNGDTSGVTGSCQFENLEQACD